MDIEVRVNYGNNAEEPMFPYYVVYNRKRYKFDVVTEGFISPLTGELICTPGFPVSNIISLQEMTNLYLSAETILFQHTENYAYIEETNQMKKVNETTNRKSEFKTDYSWLECALIDGDITPDELKIAKNINFKINGEDYGLFLSQIRDWMSIKDIHTVSYVQFESDEFDGAYEVTLKSGNKKIFGWKDFCYGLKEIIA